MLQEHRLARRPLIIGAPGGGGLITTLAGEFFKNGAGRGQPQTVERKGHTTEMQQEHGTREDLWTETNELLECSQIGASVTNVTFLGFVQLQFLLVIPAKSTFVLSVCLYTEFSSKPFHIVYTHRKDHGLVSAGSTGSKFLVQADTHNLLHACSLLLQEEGLLESIWKAA